MRRLLSACGLFALGVANTLVAQTLSDSPQRLEQQRGADDLGQRQAWRYQVIGATPLELFTVHIVDKGKPLYDYGR